MAHIRSRKHSKPVHLLALLAASVPAAGMAQQTTTLPTVTVKEAPRCRTRPTNRPTRR